MFMQTLCVLSLMPCCTRGMSLYMLYTQITIMVLRSLVLWRVFHKETKHSDMRRKGKRHLGNIKTYKIVASDNSCPEFYCFLPLCYGLFLGDLMKLRGYVARLSYQITIRIGNKYC